MIEPIIDSRVIEQLSKLLKSARHIVITCHLSPDGDALGSTLGLCRVLRNMGKDAYVVVPDQVPRALQFIPAVRDVVVYTMAQLRGRFLVRNADLIFCLDFNGADRVDEMREPLEQAKAKKVMIDHHLDPSMDTVLTISHPNMSSTSELVFRIVWQLGAFEEMTKEWATCVYCGMMTDTGG